MPSASPSDKEAQLGAYSPVLRGSRLCDPAHYPVAYLLVPCAMFHATACPPVRLFRAFAAARIRRHHEAVPCGPPTDAWETRHPRRRKKTVSPAGYASAKSASRRPPGPQSPGATRSGRPMECPTRGREARRAPRSGALRIRPGVRLTPWPRWDSPSGLSLRLQAAAALARPEDAGKRKGTVSGGAHHPPTPVPLPRFPPPTPGPHLTVLGLKFPHVAAGPGPPAALSGARPRFRARGGWIARRVRLVKPGSRTGPSDEAWPGSGRQRRGQQPGSL